MTMLTREQILARKLGRDVVEIDGGEVCVRGLNRTESIAVAELESAAERDAYIIATGMTDPVMTIDDVRAWSEQDGGGPGSALEKITRRISELSATVEGAGKSGVARTRRKPGS